jgi:hypothetical protein
MTEAADGGRDVGLGVFFVARRGVALDAGAAELVVRPPEA